MIVCKLCGGEFETSKELFDHQTTEHSRDIEFLESCETEEDVEIEGEVLWNIIPLEALPEIIEVYGRGSFVAIKVFGHYDPDRGLIIENTELI